MTKNKTINEYNLNDLLKLSNINIKKIVIIVIIIYLI